MPSDLASSCARRWVTTTATIDSLIPGSALRQRFVGLDLQAGLFEPLADVACGVFALVGAHDFFDAAGLPDDAVVDPHRGLAQPGQEFVGMACEYQDSGTLDQLLQSRLGLLEEVGVDGADPFVEQQDLRVD